MQVRVATAKDIAFLPDIEYRADEVFAAYPEFSDLQIQPGVMPGNAQDLPEGAVVLVAESEDELVGFVYGYPLDDQLFIGQLSVVPEMQKQGIGTQLLIAFFAAAGQQGLRGVTLITYAHLPFNAPYYEARGFRHLSANDMSPSLARVYAADKAEWGRYGPRVAMGLTFMD